MFKGKKFLFGIILLGGISLNNIAFASPDLDNLTNLGVDLKGTADTENNLNIIKKNDGINDIANYTQGQKVKTVPELINSIIKVSMGLFATILLGIIIYSGIKVIISKGNPEAYKKGIGLLTSSIIGMCIVLFSYVISDFAIKTIGTVIDNNESNNGGSGVCSTHSDCGEGRYCCLSGYVGCRINSCYTMTPGTYCGVKKEDDTWTGSCHQKTEVGYEDGGGKKIISSNLCDDGGTLTTWFCFEN